MKRKFSKIKPDKEYKLFRYWATNYDDWSCDIIDKPMLLRVDHKSPLITHWNCYEKRYYDFRVEGIKEV